MKLRTKIAAVAAVLVAFVGLASWLVPGGGVTLAFGDVVEAFNNVHSATWKTSTVVKIKVPQDKTVTSEGIGMFLAPSHERTETTSQGNKSIQIVDGQKDKVIALDPAAKTAMVINLKNLPAKSPFGQTFQGLRELVAAAQGGKGGKVERLGVETIDGRRAEGFRIRLGAMEVKVLGDPKTSLPVRVEEVVSNGPEVRIVMTNFQIGVDLDESLFSLDVPAGYTVQQTMQIDASKKPMAYLAETLKMAAEYNGGVFPPALRGEQGIDGILRRALADVAKEHPKDPTQQQKAKAMDIAVHLGGAYGFLFALPPDAWHYAGKDVKLNTPNKPIFWLKQKKGGRCMVLYADLSVKEIPAEEAPKDPQPEGSPKR